MMKDHAVKLMLCFCALLTAVACQSDEPQVATVSPQDATSQALAAAILASSEPPLDFDQLQEELDSAEALWQSQNITKYRLEVTYREPESNTQNLTLLVEDGVVMQEKHTCIPLRTCILTDVDVQTFEMDTLFNTARQVISLQDHNTQITFNERLGFPNIVGYPEAVWIVQSVQPLDD